MYQYADLYAAVLNLGQRWPTVPQSQSPCSGRFPLRISYRRCRLFLKVDSHVPCFCFFAKITHTGNATESINRTTFQATFLRLTSSVLVRVNTGQLRAAAFRTATSNLRMPRPTRCRDSPATPTLIQLIIKNPIKNPPNLPENCFLKKITKTAP